MSKIRMALLKNCSVIGIAWLDKNGTGQVIRINIPNRRQEIIRRVLKEGIDFPNVKKEEPSKLILPASELLRQEAEKAGKPIIAEL